MYTANSNRLSFQTLNSKRAKDDGGQILSFGLELFVSGMFSWDIVTMYLKNGLHTCFLSGLNCTPIMLCMLRI